MVLTEALQKLTISDVIKWKEANRPQRAVVSLEHNASIAHALKVLAKHRILSAPLVMSPSLEDLDSGGLDEGSTAPALLGWCDVNDILRALLQHIKKEHSNGIPTNMLLLMSALEGTSKTFGERTLVTLSGGEDKSLVYETEAAAELLPTITEHLLNNSGIPGKVVHRLAVFDASGDIQHVVSQLDIVRLLASEPQRYLGETGNQSLQQLGLMPTGPSHVVCIDPHVPTIIAFDKMMEAGVRGAAVVSATGELVANLSSSDLRGIQPEHCGILALPVAEFLALLHGTSYLGYSQRGSEQAEHPFFAASRHHKSTSPAPGEELEGNGVRLITCKPTSHLKEVLTAMSDNHVHRVYVVDPHAKPQVVAVVTPTDILRWLVAQPRHTSNDDAAAVKPVRE